MTPEALAVFIFAMSEDPAFEMLDGLPDPRPVPLRS